MPPQPTLLLVEDDPDHVLIAKRVLRELRFPAIVEVCRDGKDALERLLNRPDLPVPALVLLDLNLPRLGGKEVLKFMKEHVTLRTIPVIMLSSSDREEDMLLVEKLGAAAYISKARGIDQLAKDFDSLRPLVESAGPRDIQEGTR